MDEDFARLAARTQDELWDRDAAQRYDSPGVGMFAPDVIDATVARLGALAGGGRALELAVGTGRVAIPLVESGTPVVGVELSRPMIDRLREKVDAATLPVVHGDMSQTRVDADFTLVYLVYNTIGNLLTQEQQVDCFRNAAAHLSSGGRFVIELMVPQFRDLPDGGSAHVFTATDGYVGLDLVDPVEQHLVSYHFHFDDGETARVARTPQRYVWPAELDLMARLAGFALECRHADWTGSPFTSTSTSHVSVYRLR